MKNAHLARLDRQLRLRGEAVQLQRQVGTTTQSLTKADVRGVVKTLGIQQLIGGISQTNYTVIISPTDLRRAGWPGAITAAIPSGLVSNKDNAIPTISDKMWFRGAIKTISRADAIYDGDECVRIELTCTG
ncbi:hypothetical protein [Bradyrhizobium sp. 6(2017)]|uniref:hypothetical protein n=1 Tax=Bradyrhizobium sp. 6(2017) TaxID=1197460 RepID=UPI0013E136AA|nr:hypothetical protein [Bradyrhizobium sp. 6(2017)]QIG92884.1 hypothetical protein G6P99_10440 [Bradyrhizobium sp. 6(2017)]